MSDLAREKGETALDPPWTITPVGGLDKIPTFIALLGASDLDVVVVMDVAAGGNLSLAFVTALQALPPRQLAVLILRDVLGLHTAEVADMLGPAKSRSRAPSSGRAPASSTGGWPATGNRRPPPGCDGNRCPSTPVHRPRRPAPPSPETRQRFRL